MNWVPNADTEAGTVAIGIAANQLDSPTEIYLSEVDGFTSILDQRNFLFEHWLVDATTSMSVAGSPSGPTGYTAALVRLSSGLALDESGRRLSVSNSEKECVQRFSLASFVGLIVKLARLHRK